MSFHIGNEAYELGIHIMQKYPLSSVISDCVWCKSSKDICLTYILVCKYHALLIFCYQNVFYGL